MAKKKALGRGLSALIGEVEQAYENNLNDNSALVVEIDIDLIKPNPLQPRKTFNESSLIELSNSIKEHGILQPILIYEDNNEYFLIAGERRLKASKIANLQTIRAIVVDIKLEKLRELALIENIQREDLNPIDLALSYDALIKDYNITQDELASKLQKSRTQITNTLALLRLPKDAQKLLIEGRISQGHAKVLVNLSNDDFTLALNSIIGQKLSVRETENLVKNIKTAPKNHNKKQIIEFKDDLSKLSNIFQSIDIDTKISNNSLILKFKTKEKVNRLIKILSNLNNL
ncbi:chromosome partitioning protein ParB [Helicobacter sp. 16-1353]|uniref:ParB/RepB/Spo0J family partition protein n=1 Tax=Helicobacter sp. 16-1353 TaxID=2004996 RepID=UPI000DCE514B|nr:ParB/RepB/Spo0J family partition protein [Helicobacter sp. 16-1353]RAX54073.1 chromosome partitioning protein ParB [Helicobacter sp. 16-1353]